MGCEKSFQSEICLPEGKGRASSADTQRALSLSSQSEATSPFAGRGGEPEEILQGLYVPRHIRAIFYPVYRQVD